MAKITINLTIEQGTDFNQTLQLRGDSFGNPLNLSSYSFSSGLKSSYQNSNTNAVFSITTTDAANGLLKIAMSSSNTANLKGGKYFYDIVAKSNSNTFIKVVDGIVFVDSTSTIIPF